MTKPKTFEEKRDEAVEACNPNDYIGSRQECFIAGANWARLETILSPEVMTLRVLLASSMPDFAQGVVDDRHIAIRQFDNLINKLTERDIE